jgi:excisionase family DNA binding protein
MTDDELKAQLDRIEQHGKETSEFLGCFRFFLIGGALLAVVLIITNSKYCGGWMTELLNNEDCFTIKELADSLSVSDDTIRRRMAEIPDLEYYQPRRKILIPKKQAERILNRIERQSKK